MKALVKHLLRNNYAEIINRSRVNCHAIGLHSVMLLESPGKTIRLFYAETNHVLHHNCPEWLSTNQTIAFHPHRCNLTMECVLGQVGNWVVEPSDVGGVVASKWKYQSQILSNVGSFALIEEDRILATRRYDVLTPGRSLQLDASDIHTVYLPRGEEAAWFIYEGEEDPDYEPYCWSARNLNNFTFDNLYRSMTDAHLVQILRRCDLL